LIDELLDEAAALDVDEAETAVSEPDDVELADSNSRGDEDVDDDVDEEDVCGHMLSDGKGGCHLELDAPNAKAGALA